MKFLSTFLSVFFLGYSFFAHSQSRSVILNLQLEKESKYEIDLLAEGNSLSLESGVEDGVWVSTPVSVPDFGDAPFYMYALRWEGAQASAMVRMADENGQWIDGRILEQDHHSTEEKGFQSELHATSADTRFLQFRLKLEKTGGNKLENIEVFWCNPGKSEKVAGSVSTMRTDTTPCPLPAVLPREGWCPSGNCFPDPTPQPTEVTHLIVHHSAGGNTSSDWAAVVRGIWDFHVNFNGWDDIGYNWLIDPNGVIYDGRGNDLQGAHFCGANPFTAGICMLGTYTDVIPSGEARRSLVELLAWKCGDKELDPLGVSFHEPSDKNLRIISGHRDGCATECPGNAFYAIFEDIRQATQEYIENDCFLADVAQAGSREKEIKTSPNPFSDELNIQLPGNSATGTYSLFALGSGRLMLQGTFSGKKNMSLQLAHLPAAPYLLVFKDQQSGEIFRKKIVKR